MNFGSLYYKPYGPISAEYLKWMRSQQGQVFLSQCPDNLIYQAN